MDGFGLCAGVRCSGVVSLHIDFCEWAIFPCVGPCKRFAFACLIFEFGTPDFQSDGFWFDIPRSRVANESKGVRIQADFLGTSLFLASVPGSLAS